MKLEIIQILNDYRQSTCNNSAIAEKIIKAIEKQYKCDKCSEMIPKSNK